MPRVRVLTASRLHFGLLTPAGDAIRQFGGVGAMVGLTAVELTVQSASTWSCHGPEAPRAAKAAGTWAHFHRLNQLPPCELQVHRIQALHCGLGVGTQLALAVAAALDAWSGYAPATAERLAQSAGRGQRSAIGTYGFLHGGFLVEAGRQSRESLSPLDTHLSLPIDWRWVLLRPEAASPGLSGNQEQEAFARLPHQALAARERLWNEVRERLIPAARSGDLLTFGDSLYFYGYQAGLEFAAIQGGPFNGPHVSRLVAQIREFGIRGVGQSSWGPTVFALCGDQSAAESLARYLSEIHPGLHLQIVATANEGASVVCSL